MAKDKLEYSSLRIYNELRMAAALRFDWDDANVGHIRRHEVAPEEAEQVLANDPIVVRIARRNGERRTACLGRTNTGRHLVVVYTMRGRMHRVVTAYPMNEQMRREYAQQKAANRRTKDRGDGPSGLQ